MSPAPTAGRRFLILCLVLIALLFAVRLPWLLQAPLQSDSDLSVIGLMAAHIAEGKHFPLFMYGQGYMGASEAYLAALLFKLLGRSLAVQSLASLFFFALFAWLNAVLIRRLHGPGPGSTALLITALAPPAMAWWFSSGFGGYCAVLALGATAVLIWTVMIESRGRARLWLVLAGILTVTAGLWTYAVFWLFILPPLALSFLFFMAVTLGVWREHPKAGSGKKPRIAALIILGLGLLDLLHALALGWGGMGYHFSLAGLYITSPSPETAMSDFLPRSLGIILAGLGAWLWGRVGALGLRIISRRAGSHLAWIVTCLAGVWLAGRIYALGETSQAAYAPFQFWPRMDLAGWAGTWERLGWLVDDLVVRAFGTGVPWLSEWAAWVLFAPILLALALTGFEAVRALCGQTFWKWLEENRLPFIFSASSAGLLGAVLITRAVMDEIGYRYLLLLIAWWPLLLVWLGQRLVRLARPLGWIFVAIPLVILLISTGYTLTKPGAWEYVPDKAKYASLEELMGRAGTRYGRADYWVAYDATNLTHERLIITPSKEFPVRLIRYLDHHRAVAEAEKKAYIFRRAIDWRDLERIRAQFKATRRYFSWLENKDWILLVVSGADDQRGLE